MSQLNQYTIPAMLRHSYQAFSSRPSLVFVGEENRTYAQLGNEVHQVASKLAHLGISKGDRVAILSTNMPNWGIAYFAISTLGGIVVPILPDFSPTEISNIIHHSESKAIFVSETLVNKVESLQLDGSLEMIRIETFSKLSGDPISLNNDLVSDFDSIDIHEDDVASIIYTSGTTGKSKGVMLTHKNIVWDAEHGDMIQKFTPNDRMLSLLPLSHSYENTLGLILPILRGTSVHYLRKLPTPSVLIPALQLVKPTIMLSVPLIIEKIYKKQIEPKFTTNWLVRFLYHHTPVRILLHRIAGKKLKQTFGGELVFFGIGGAKLDGAVERFLLEGKFPYSIGYGLTETAPLIAGAAPGTTRLQTIGPEMPGVTFRIDQPDKKNGQGEIWVKGPNVMKGYYKEPELTREVLTPDGWLKTGDLGSFDAKGYLSFRGRSKSMIVSASGENVFPEEIELVINSFRHVVESLVIERKGKIVALVQLNMEELEVRYNTLLDQAELFNAALDELLVDLQQYVNSRVNKFSKVQQVILQVEPFEKTPTQKIKRFLYS